jgi:hypothetical protein
VRGKGSDDISRGVIGVISCAISQAFAVVGGQSVRSPACCLGVCASSRKSWECDSNCKTLRRRLSGAEHQGLVTESHRAQQELPTAFTASYGAPRFKVWFGLSETEAVGELDQGADGVEADFAVWIHVAKIADLHEPGREDVLKEASDELHGIDGHGSPAVAVRFSVPEGNAVILDLEDAAVGDGHFEDIGGQVLDAGIAFTDCLGVDVPVSVPD